MPTATTRAATGRGQAVDTAAGGPPSAATGRAQAVLGTVQRMVALAKTREAAARGVIPNPPKANPSADVAAARGAGDRARAAAVSNTTGRGGY